MAKMLLTSYEQEPTHSCVETQKKGDPYGSPWICVVFRDARPCVSTTAVRLYNNIYRFTNVFVTIPASVVTRTKYMPLERLETLMRVGFSTTFTVLMSLP